MKNDMRIHRAGFRQAFARLLVNERWTRLTVPLFCIVLTLIASSVLLLILGKNPITAFYGFLAGNGFAVKASYGAGTGVLSDFFQFLNIMAWNCFWTQESQPTRIYTWQFRVQSI